MKSTQTIIVLALIIFLTSCGSTTSIEETKTNELPKVEVITPKDAQIEQEVEEEIDEDNEKIEDKNTEEVEIQTEENAPEAMEKTETTPEVLEIPVEEVKQEVIPTTPAPEEESANIPEEKTINLTQNYSSPGGPESFSLSINTSDGKIQNIDISVIEAGNVWQKYISSFANSINNATNGLTIEEASEIGIVSGASLTTNAFKAALKNM